MYSSRLNISLVLSVIFVIQLFQPVIVDAQDTKSTKINRQELVNRHQVKVKDFNPLGSLSVGNGEFAFTVDATGLQTFPEVYEKGIPLGTQSQWGWHSFPNPAGYTFKETLAYYDFHERKIPYPIQFKEPGRPKEASEWFRINPHRLHLGIIGLAIKKKDGTLAKPADIKNIQQVLDLWNGQIMSSFQVEGEPVEVITAVHQSQDLVAARVQSNLVAHGRLKLAIRFPYPSGQHADAATDWKSPDKHTTTSTNTPSSTVFKRTLDQTNYFVKLDWSGKGTVKEKDAHSFELTPTGNILQFSALFTTQKLAAPLPTFSQTQVNSHTKWHKFWQEGGAVDFSGSTDPRAKELERRTILSQYLMAIQCAGSMPPQETGLTYNSWYGKFHLEMHWWHAVHFALWNRVDLMEKSLGWYTQAAKGAREIARRQGYEGVRWQKMTDPNGVESPSGVGSFLIWQQPHFIYMAELSYRHHKDRKTLDKYKNLVFATADFMASYAWLDKKNNRYILGKGLIPAQECFKPEETFNPPFELSYWFWALSTAQSWRERLNMPRNAKWDDILARLSSLYQTDGLYVPAESVPNAYKEGTHMYDHPAVLGAYGILPLNRLFEVSTMQKTFDFVWDKWDWKHTWGWDFPMTAMTATRLNQPEKAMDALFMNPQTNTYLPNGHNYMDQRLRLYLPGNGSLLTAVAMMCAGYDGNKAKNPGIPKNGKWNVKWENLKPMP